MTDEQIDRLVRLTDPYAAAEVRSLQGADLALLEEIMSTPTIEEAPDLTARRRHRSLRSRLVTGVAAAAAITAVIGVPAWLAERDGADPGTGTGPQAVESGDGTTDQVVYSSAAIRAAEKNPRLLIDEPGWAATNVYGFTKGEGTIVFAQGDRDLEMNWYPAKAYDFYYEDRLDVSEPERISVAGQDGALFRYSAHDFAVMLEPRGGSFVELRTGIGGWEDKAAVLAVLTKVKAVDVDTWLAAMPPEIVQPDGTRKAVASILADVPKPPGLAENAFDELGPMDRYQLGAEVINAVTCGWIEAWKQAIAADDELAEDRAVEALQSTRQWKILDEMVTLGGDYSQVVWQVADRVAAGDGPARVEESFGCHAQTPSAGRG